MPLPPPKKLALFFSNGIGLWNWERKGLLSREITLYQQLQKQGWQILFFTYDRTKKLPTLPPNINVICQWPFVIPKRFNFLYELILPFIRFHRRKDLSLIITNQAYRGWPAIVAGKIWNRKVVARCGMVFGERAETTGQKSFHVNLINYLEKFTFKNANICIVPTLHLSSWIQSNYNIPLDKIKVIPNFVDTNIFRPQPSKKETKDILVVARLEKTKRHKLLLEVAKGMGWRLRFIGDGTMREELENHARQDNIDLELLPAIPNKELPAYFSATKLFLIFSQWEGHPKALLEAMACGCACVGINSQGINNVIKDGHTGCLVESEISSIRKTIEHLLDNQEKREELGNNAHHYILKNVSLEKITRTYSETFETLLENN